MFLRYFEEKNMKKLTLALLIVLLGTFQFSLPSQYGFEDMNLDLDDGEFYEEDYTFSEETEPSAELTEAQYQAMQAQQQAAQQGIEKSSTLADEIRKGSTSPVTGAETLELETDLN
jgi:hypothetical protein